MRIHGTVVEIEGGGVLLLGPPGSGKSDLALRLLGRGGVLVADDQIDLSREGTALFASAPAALAGLLEIREFGIIRTDAKPRSRIFLGVDLVSGQTTTLPRLAERRYKSYLGVRLPVIAMRPFTASGADRLLFIARAVRENGESPGLRHAPADRPADSAGPPAGGGSPADG